MVYKMNEKIIDGKKVSAEIREKIKKFGDILIKESLLNPGILGDINEPLLKIAIDQITGDASSIDNDFQFREISSPLDLLKEMIIIDDNDIE